MLVTNNDRFEGADFALQIMSKGSFIDTGTGQPDKAFSVEATTIRLNWVALNEWLSSIMCNRREVYEDGPAGDAQWEAHKTEYAERRKTVEGKIITSLGLDPGRGSIMIRQVQSEVFTVLNIWEVLTKNQAKKEGSCDTFPITCDNRENGHIIKRLIMEN